jgi:hypothetical protein
MTFNLKEFLSRTAAKTETPSSKKGQDAIPTEVNLRGGNESKEVVEIFEQQLEPHRKEENDRITEVQLDKVRKEAISDIKITEGRLDDSKSKLVTHRDDKTHVGDVPKLEEKRLASKPVENEKYEAASTTDKKKMWPIFTGKDGIRTASPDFDIVWVKTAYNEEYDLPGERAILEDERMVERLDPDLEDLIDEVSEDVTKRRARGGEVDPTEDIGAADEIEEEEEKFEIAEINDVDAGEGQGPSSMRQYSISFDPFEFPKENKARSEATSYIADKFNLPLEAVQKRMIFDFNKGLVTINIDSKELKSPAQDTFAAV